MSYGPFQSDIAPGERIARLRAMQALCLGFARQFPELGRTLAAAETDPQCLVVARDLIDRLPTKNRRRLLATYADLARGRWDASCGK
jgi:hypothetical protein